MSKVKLDLPGLGMFGYVMKKLLAHGDLTEGQAAIANSMLTTSPTSVSSRCTLRRAGIRGIRDRRCVNNICVHYCM